MDGQLTEAQQALTELIESSIEDQIDAIGEPKEEDGLIKVPFLYGDSTFNAEIDSDLGTIRY